MEDAVKGLIKKCYLYRQSLRGAYLLNTQKSEMNESAASQSAKMPIQALEDSESWL